MDGSNLIALEAAHDGPFRFRHAGETYTVTGPANLKLHQLLAILEVGHIPGTPRMSAAKRDLLFGRWMAHYDLPTLDRLRRLAFLVDRYRSEIEYDLAIHARQDLTTLWKQRRFRYLLNLIDHLPRETWYNEAVSNDEEHSEMIAKSLAERPESSERPAPPMRTWTPEVDMMAKVVDAVRSVNHTLAAVNSEKGKTPKPPEPEPRPVSAIDKAARAARNAARVQKHKDLTMRLLPHKRPDYVPPPTVQLDKNGRARDARGRFVKA